MRRLATLQLGLAALVAVATAAIVAPPASAAPPSWKPLARPWQVSVQVIDVAAFPPAGVALAATGSRVALSVDGGIDWLQRGPGPQGPGEAIVALDFSDAAHGVVVGTNGLILVTGDGGRSWRSPVVTGGAPSRDLLDVDLAGEYGYACGASGILLATGDGGDTWTRVPPVTVDAVTTIAVGPDGMGVAGTAGGTLIAGTGAAWDTVATGLQPVLDVAAPSQIVRSDDWPDLVASLGSSLLGSTDGSAFDWSLESTAGPWPALAWAGRPSGDLLLAGSGGTVHSVDALTPPAVTPRASTGIGDAKAGAAPGGQSVAYILDTTGRVARTLSSAQRTATLEDPPAVITAGASFALASVVHVAAPGALILEGKVPGGSWRQKTSFGWTSDSWGTRAFSLSPTLNTSYRLLFSYGGRRSLISDVTSTVKVRPALTPNHRTYDLTRSTVYRFGGTVYPKLAGEELDLYTDRGGSWHKIDIGGTVTISQSGTWTSRAFGTPVRETYHLKAHIRATIRHSQSWTPVVTVTIR